MCSPFRRLSSRRQVAAIARRVMPQLLVTLTRAGLDTQKACQICRSARWCWLLVESASLPSMTSTAIAANPKGSGTARFERENDMVRPLHRSAWRFTPGRMWLTFEEVPALSGVVDLVRIRPRMAVLMARGAAAVSPVTNYAALRLLLRNESSFTARDVSEDLGLALPRVSQSILPLLENLGWVSRESRTQWAQCMPYVIPATRVATVELKLHDWRRALWQAMRHAAYADQSWTALDAIRSRPALRAREAFAHVGVGVLLIDAAATVRDAVAVAIQAHGNPTDLAARALVVENCLQLKSQGLTRGPDGTRFGTPARLI